ncbi:500_t:CDS:1, partial [Scutellospora calospora]
MKVIYQKIKVFDTYVEKEFRFNNKNKQIISIWLSLTEEKNKEFGHSKLLEEDMKTDKILNKKESKEFIEKAIDNFYRRIINNYMNI